MALTNHFKSVAPRQTSGSSSLDVPFELLYAGGAVLVAFIIGAWLFWRLRIRERPEPRDPQGSVEQG